MIQYIQCVKNKYTSNSSTFAAASIAQKGGRSEKAEKTRNVGNGTAKD